MAAVADTAKALVSSLWGERLSRAVHGYAFNPLLVRDLRSFLRGRRPLALQIGYLLVAMIAMAIAALGCRQARIMSAQYGGGFRPNYGQTMFVAMFETQVVLLCLVVVGYSAGAISLEQEKRTFEMLAVTTLSSLEIVLGKIAAITALCAMLLVTSVPLAAICLLLGGVSPGEIARCYGLLLYCVPMWSAGCLLISVLVGRTIGAYVTSMVCMALFLFGATAGTFYGAGALSPFMLPIPDVLARFLLFKAPLLTWISPLVVYGLLGALCAVAAAEAIPLHRPRRSTALRLLLMFTTFTLVFLFYSAALQQLVHQYLQGGGSAWNRPKPPTADNFAAVLPFGLMLAWMLAMAAVPVFTSYLPPAEAGRNALAWLLGPVSVRRWFQREANVGWRSVLLLFAAFAAGLVLPLVIAQATGMATGRIFTSSTIAMLLFAALLYALSLCAYSFWGAAFSLAWKDRRISALLTILAMLAVNVLPMYHQYSPYSFRKLQFLVHPALVMFSPLLAADGALSVGASTFYWGRLWESPVWLFGISVGYQVTLVAAGLLYLRKVGRKVP